MITEVLARLLSTHDIPEPPPADPMNLLQEWFDDARQHGGYDDFNAIGLATATPDGTPSVRMVLCKSIDVREGSLTFFSNYESRKGRELEANPKAAAVFHWPHAKRQARIEGITERLSSQESDIYFHSRSLLARVGACVSNQSARIESRARLLKDALEYARSAALGAPVTRPQNWGGYRLRATSVELWSGCDGRLHQRIVWHRDGTTPEARWKHHLLAP